MKTDANTRLLGLIGNPVSHSLSPKMHSYISSVYNDNYVYNAFQVEPSRIGDAIKGLCALGACGVNVTAPYKSEVIKFIDFTDENAKMYNSVNTIKFKDSKSYGYCTDADGFCLMLENEKIQYKDKDILVLGAGGASKPICIKLALDGAKSITIINRTKEKADELSRFIEGICKTDIFSSREHSRYDIVINTTSVGMTPDINSSPINDFSFVDKNTCAVDIIYNPAKTLFLEQMENHGAAKAVNGLGMLIYQGILSYEIFTDKKIDHNIYNDIKREVFKA